MPIRRGEINADKFKSFTMRLVTGNLSINGVQTSSVATVGTTAVNVLDSLVDPGVNLDLKELKLDFYHSFQGLPADFVGSLIYYWRGRSEYTNQQGTRIDGAWVNLTGTQQVNVGTQLVVTGTFSGYAALGSLPGIPLRLQLVTVGIRASVVAASVSNDARAQFQGIIIPGT